MARVAGVDWVMGAVGLVGDLLMGGEAGERRVNEGEMERGEEG